MTDSGVGRPLWQLGAGLRLSFLQNRNGFLFCKNKVGVNSRGAGQSHPIPHPFKYSPYFSSTFSFSSGLAPETGGKSLIHS